MLTTAMLAVQFTAAAGPAVAVVRAPALKMSHDTSVPVSPVASRYQKAKPTPSWQAPKVTWPSGTGQVVLGPAAPGADALKPSASKASASAARTGAAASSALVQAGSLPLWLKALPSNAQSSAGLSPLVSASATIESRASAAAAGVNGVLFTLKRSDGVKSTGAVQVSLSYAQFQDAFGGDWDARLALVELPACAVTTPQSPSCRVQTPVKFLNDGAAKALSASVTLPDAAAIDGVTGLRPASAPQDSGTDQELVLAATATTSSDAGSGGGDYTATALKASGSWQAGGSSDAFTYSYPFSTPSVPGSLEPSLTLSYDSQSVDGLTSNTNNQAGDFGDGWSLTGNYIERSYQSCHQNPTGPTQTYDYCWSGNNQLTLDFNGQTTAIVQDDATGTYHLQDDSNERVRYATGAINGTQLTDYWIVTTPDGTEYYFGLNELPGYASGDATTNSVDTEPVYATASGQPCYNATFSSSYCEQAYQWNLDYVVDTQGDAISYWYNPTTGYYAQDLGTTAPSSSAYTRDSVLSKIEYGQRAGAVYSSTPAGEVVLTSNGRCSTSATGCSASTLSASTASNFPDIPYDQNCASGSSCSIQSPTFWSEYEITGIETEALDGTTLMPVDSWAFTYAFPAITGAGDTSTPSLWLNSITQTGLDAEAGGSTSPIGLPSVTFTGEAFQNRVNLTNGYPWITRQRLTKITTETGEVVTVNYSAPACGSATPSNDAQNTMLCYPVYWYPAGDTSPVKEYFNKYIVQSVTEEDMTYKSGNDTIETTYTPVGSPAWHYDDDPLTPSNQRTWDQWRGYPGMAVSTGQAPDPVTDTQYTYFQGMDGDFLSPTSTRTVTVSDTRGDPAVDDLNQYAGMTYETQVLNGSSLVTDTIDTPWTGPATATHALSGGVPSQQSFMTGTSAESEYTPLADGATQETETQYTHDSFGRVVQVNDLGDVSTSSDDQCTTTTYADNSAEWIYNASDETSTVSVNCSTTPVLPADAISDSQTFYDGSTTLGAAPTVGDATTMRLAASYSGASPVYVTMSTATVDQYGRVLTSTDADGRQTVTAYSPSNGAEPTSITVTDPMSLATTTTYDPLRDLPLATTSPGGYTTTLQYNAMGQLTAVYEPGRAVSTGSPNSKYTYTISDSSPSMVDAYALNDDGTYRVSETLYDSMMRAAEVQTENVDGSRDITDSYYNTDGWESEVTDPYSNAASVSTTLVQAQAGTIPSITGYSYDGVGRVTAKIAYGIAPNTTTSAETWRTSYIYGGNFVTTVPPAGGTAETDVSNALGQQTDLIQYLSGDPTNYVTDPTSDYTDTRYTYYPSGKRATEVDAAGDSWSWDYNLLGFQTDSFDPDEGHGTTVYDNAGQLVASTDARGKQTTYKYDADGRAVGSYDTTATQVLSSSNQLTKYVYDTLKKGLPTSSTSYSNGDTYTSAVDGYDTSGRPEATTVSLVGEGTTLATSAGYTTTYGYTLTGSLATQTDPAEGGLPQEALHYTYDEFGDPTMLNSTGGATWTYVSGVGYDEFRQPVQYSMPTAPTAGNASAGSVGVGLTYDPQTHALTEIDTTASGSATTVDDLKYSYGSTSGPVSPGAGLLTKSVDSQNGGATVDTQCFTYDYAERLQQAWTALDGCAATPEPGNSSTVGGADAPYWQSWTYDAAGDRLTETDHDVAGDTANDTVTTYNYPALGSSVDQPDTLTSTTATGPGAAADTAAYTYDVAGNTTSINGGALGNETLTWNDEDQLQSDATGAGTTGYVYDASGNLVVQRDPGSTVFYNGDTQLTLNVTANTLSGVRYYTMGGTTVAERTSAGVVSVLVPDRQGTDLLAINTDSAQTVSRRQYLPFGGLRGTSTAWVGGNLGYVGGTADSATGLENLGAREYDTVTGRFVNGDSILEASDPTQMGGYDYSANDPVSESDPEGTVAGDSTGLDYLHNYAIEVATEQIELQADEKFGFTGYEIQFARTAVAIPGAGRGGGTGYPDIVLKASGVTYIWEMKASSESAPDASKQLKKYITFLKAESGAGEVESGWNIPTIEEPIPAGYTLSNAAGSISSVEPGQYIIVSSNLKYSGVLQYTVRRDQGERKPNFSTAIAARAQLRAASRRARIEEAAKGSAAAVAAAAALTAVLKIFSEVAESLLTGVEDVLGEASSGGIGGGGGSGVNGVGPSASLTYGVSEGAIGSLGGSDYEGGTGSFGPHPY